MRPYNSYRNPELSQPVSSEENTLTSKPSNSNTSFDILRSLSESISVDCGSFEISAPTEYYQTSSAPSNVAFVDPRGKEFQTPVERVPSTPVNREPSRMTPPSEKSSVNAASDMDDDNYDCMNDPNYRAQNYRETNSPSFEELMARTAEGIARMREETQAAYSVPGSSPKQEKRVDMQNSKAKPSQTKSLEESVQRIPKEEVKPSADAQSESSTKKGFLSSIRWDKTRKLLFSRETIKLVVLSVAISALIVSAVIYRNSSRRNNGLPESEDIVVNQSAPEFQSSPSQGYAANENNGESTSPNNGEPWTQPDGSNWNDPVASNQNPFQSNYQSPTFDGSTPSEYNPNDPNGYLNPEDAGRQLASPHDQNNGNSVVYSAPIYDAGPMYAEVAPAVGSQYNPNEYESPVLEDDSVREYSETGYNSNYMR